MHRGAVPSRSDKDHDQGIMPASKSRSYAEEVSVHISLTEDLSKNNNIFFKVFDNASGGVG